jgi:hypothetical protein
MMAHHRRVTRLAGEGVQQRPLGDVVGVQGPDAA